MIKEPPKLTIQRDFPRPTSAQIQSFAGIPTGNVVDALNGAGAFSTQINELDLGVPTTSVTGPALTAGNGPADVLASLAAPKFLQPGDILMAGAAGHQGCAAAGDRLLAAVRNAGAVALVTDGPVRDIAGIAEVGLPVWATGVTPATPFATGPGTIGLPIYIGGQRVASGDLIVADSDGVVVVPFAQIDQVIDALDEVRRLEDERDVLMANGAILTDELEALLDSKDVQYLDRNAQ